MRGAGSYAARLLVSPTWSLVVLAVLTVVAAGGGGASTTLLTALGAAAVAVTGVVAGRLVARALVVALLGAVRPGGPARSRRPGPALPLGPGTPGRPRPRAPGALALPHPA